MYKKRKCSKTGEWFGVKPFRTIWKVCTWSILVMQMYHSVLDNIGLSMDFVPIDSFEWMVKFYELCFIGSTIWPSFLLYQPHSSQCLPVKGLSIFIVMLDNNKQYYIELKSQIMTNEPYRFINLHFSGVFHMINGKKKYKEYPSRDLMCRERWRKI